MKKRSPKYVEGRDIGQSRIPSDQINTSLKASLAQSLVNESPLVNACVVSTFDARPINAYDFIVENIFTYAPFNPASLDFIVPAGTIAILQRVSWIRAGSPVVAINQQINRFGIESKLGSDFINITIDGIADPQFSLMQNIMVMNLPVYIVAGPGKTISLTFFGNGGTMSVEAKMHGTLLQQTERSTNFEPGTQNPLSIRTVKE